MHDALMSTTYKHDPINVGSGHRLQMVSLSFQ